MRGCSPLAKAVWWDMCIEMRMALPRGFFVTALGAPIDLARFAKDNDYKPSDVQKAILELRNRGICSQDSQGRLYCRFIVQQATASSVAKANGSLGGNPMLTPLPQDLGVNPPLKPEDKPGVNGAVKAEDKASLKPVRSRTENREQNRDSDSLRSSAIDYETWPDDVATLKGLGLLFVARFANCHDPLKAQKHLPHYLGVLAAMRSRSVSLTQAWQAFDDALEANGDKPLFSAAAKCAMNFLPSRGRRLDDVDEAELDPMIAEFRRLG